MKLGIAFIIHILDDFLIRDPPESDNCEQNLQKFLAVCEEVGVPFKEDKTVGLCTCLIFMGLELESGKKEARFCLRINLKRSGCFYVPIKNVVK